jgi:hypothetical protein
LYQDMQKKEWIGERKQLQTRERWKSRGTTEEKGHYEDLDYEGKDEEEESPPAWKPLCTKVTEKHMVRSTWTRKVKPQINHKNEMLKKAPHKNEQCAQSYKMEVEKPKVEEYLTQTVCHLNDWWNHPQGRVEK